MHLFDPLRLKSLTLRNRIGISPMCMYSAENGVANDWHLVHLGARAVGGAGLVITEATAVSPEGRITPGDLGLWSDEQVEPLARVTRFLRQHGAVPGIQLAHAGRKASAASPWAGSAQIADDAGGWPVVGPSPVAFGGILTKVPRELTVADLTVFQSNFARAAQRALAAGYEWLEIHAAHGYLLHEFLSPIANRRTDAYGGSFENRIRLLRETVQAVRAVWPEHLPLTVRLSCTDWVEGGWDLEQTVELCQLLKGDGIDLVDCSSGGMTPDARIPSEPGYQVPFAERVRRDTGLATAAVGLISDYAMADDIIARERADLVLIARASLRDPNWPLHAAQALGQTARLPKPNQYLRS